MSVFVGPRPAFDIPKRLSCICRPSEDCASIICDELYGAVPKCITRWRLRSLSLPGPQLASTDVDLRSDTGPSGLYRPSARSAKVSGVRVWHATSWASLALAVAVVVKAGHGRGGDTDIYVQGADALLGKGSYAGIPYPPGFPLLLAPFRALDLSIGVLAVASSLAVVTLVWWLAVRLGGPVAGIVAGLVLAMSPLFREYGALVMSDAPATALLVGGLVAATAQRWRLSGILCGASAWVRISHALFTFAMPNRRAFLTMLCSVAPLAIFNVVVYGSVSGYASGAAEFGLQYLTGDVWFETVGGEPSRFSNLYLWQAILIGRFGLLVPLLPVFAAVELWHRRADAETRLAVGVVVINVVTHWFYFFQSPRFVLPSAAILVAYAGAFAGRVAADIVSRAGTRTPGSLLGKSVRAPTTTDRSAVASGEVDHRWSTQD